MKMTNLKSMTQKTKSLRKLQIEKLENQLSKGTKPNKGITKDKKARPTIPLTDNDISRINKEISILKTRI